MKKITLLLVLFISLMGIAQEIENDTLKLKQCIRSTRYANMYLSGNDIVVQDIPKAMELLAKQAEEGCVASQLQLGQVYRKGKYVQRDDILAFHYTSMAAAQDYPKALAELGTLYQRGIGCTLNYPEAYNLYERANELSDDGKGAYYIGYNYFKGLGSVEQDYAKAIEWFTMSEFPMAKHFLGIMNYFGFGMPVNKDYAYELLLDNPRLKNSAALLAHLEASKEDDDSILSDFKGVDINKETENINSLLDEEITATDIQIAQENNQLTAEQLTGNWTGKLVELDWAGEQILRLLPASLSLSKDTDTGGVKYSTTIEGSTNEDVAILLDESLYFSECHLNLSRLYQDSDQVNTLKYNLLNADLKLKTVDYIRFLVGFVDTKVLDWDEPGPPMLLVLVNDKVLTDNGMEISKELIQALLAQQGDNFINLYPNPFKNDLLIQYELTEKSTATVEIYSLDGLFSEVIANQQVQNSGKQLFQYDGSNLEYGLYVVKVTANGSVHTKMIIKEN